MSHALRDAFGARPGGANGAPATTHEGATEAKKAESFNDPFVESFRLLTLDVERLLPDGTNRSILVMSALPKEGRTTTAAGLARAFAETSPPVALVDANPGAVGDVPSEGARGYELIQPWTALHTQAAVVDYVRLVMESAKSAHGTVVVDVPPATTSSLGFFLAPLVGGVVYVMRTRRAPDAGLAGAVKAQLDLLGARILGVVVNEG